jgi:outer membrane protein assembly factor BamB
VFDNILMSLGVAALKKTKAFLFVWFLILGSILYPFMGVIHGKPQAQVCYDPTVQSFTIDASLLGYVLLDLDINGLSHGHELLWKANTTGTNYEESAVAYCDGIAYIGSCSTHGEGHDTLFAVNTSTGEILWRNPTGPGYVGPVIDGDVVYIGTSSHGYDPTNEYIYAIDRFTGEELWQRKIYGGIAESIQFDEEKVYFCSDVIYALNKADGSINWTYQMDSYVVTKPILKDNAFYTASSGGKLIKVRATDGSRIWSRTLSAGPWDNSITADDKGRIFLAIYGDQTMNAYSEDDGYLLWSYALHGRSLSFNAYHNDVVFIADTAGYVYALDAVDGTLRWEKKLGNTFDISSPSLSGGLLFIGTRDGTEGAFFALNETTGELVWKYTVGASVTAPPTIADGLLLCGTDDWHMYAFDIGVGTGNWPLNRYDAFNTAYSPDGLLTWQSIEAICTTEGNVTTCIVTNSYDHDISHIELRLGENIYADWYDSQGTLLQSNANHYTIENMANSSTMALIITTTDVQRPNKPTMPSGAHRGRIGETYTYTTMTQDPNGDQLFYLFDWGDGTDEGWIGPYQSGTTIETDHQWMTQGTYDIRVKAKDVHGLESDWSDPLSVTMPKSKSLRWSPMRFLQKCVASFPILQALLYMEKIKGG